MAMYGSVTVGNDSGSVLQWQCVTVSVCDTLAVYGSISVDSECQYVTMPVFVSGSVWQWQYVVVSVCGSVNVGSDSGSVW